jgi:sterol desaturase/sphingolipid hydroxylase (fatty acid hydroxylase superfamily)
MHPSSLLKIYISTPWLAYGAGPVFAAALGFLFSWTVCSCLERMGVATIDVQGITYTKSENRKDQINKTQSKVDWSTQLVSSLWTVAGPGAVFNACLSAFLLPHLFRTPLTELPLLPSFWEFVLRFTLCHLIGDLGLYLGHRLQHENEFLWTHFHSKHHELSTPTAVSTAYIHPVDMTLQASLPILAAVVIVQAHPLTFALYSFSRVAENGFNHSGLESSFINLLTLKCLPFRASVRHHDEHHKYSSYSGKAKNYGECFVLWDYLFGTSRKNKIK